MTAQRTTRTLARCLRAGADDHLWHQPRHGHSDPAAVPIPAISPIPWNATLSQRRFATWISKPASRSRPSLECGLHRKLHQLANLRPPQRRQHSERPKVHPGLRVMVVPGSQQVKAAGASRRPGQIFRDAGADWREAGCSMCIAMNGDQLQPGEYSVSTSNRNFEGRQGKGGRTFLATHSPPPHPPSPASSQTSGATLMKKFLPFESRLRPAPHRQYRYRSDHPRPISENNFERRPR